MPVHFLDLASAVEKLRWAEKEWRELNQQMTEAEPSATGDGVIPMPTNEHEVGHSDRLLDAVPADGPRL